MKNAKNYFSLTLGYLSFFLLSTQVYSDSPNNAPGSIHRSVKVNRVSKELNVLKLRRSLHEKFIIQPGSLGDELFGVEIKDGKSISVSSFGESQNFITYRTPIFSIFTRTGVENSDSVFITLENGKVEEIKIDYGPHSDGTSYTNRIMIERYGHPISFNEAVIPMSREAQNDMLRGNLKEALEKRLYTPVFPRDDVPKPYKIELVACKDTVKPMGFVAKQFSRTYLEHPGYTHTVTPHYSVPGQDYDNRPVYVGDSYITTVEIRPLAFGSNQYNRTGLAFTAPPTHVEAYVVEQRKGKNGVTYSKLIGRMALQSGTFHGNESSKNTECYVKESSLARWCELGDKTCGIPTEKLVPLYNQLKREFESSNKP